MVVELGRTEVERDCALAGQAGEAGFPTILRTAPRRRLNGLDGLDVVRLRRGPDANQTRYPCTGYTPHSYLVSLVLQSARSLFSFGGRHARAMVATFLHART